MTWKDFNRDKKLIKFDFVSLDISVPSGKIVEISTKFVLKMNSLIIQAGLLMLVAALVFAGQKATLEEAISKNQRADGCVCISSNFGCENIKLKGKNRMLQTGFCKLRCCEESVPGEKRKCQCFNRFDCPDDFPEENGDCVNMVECCPEKKAKRSDL